MSSRKYQLLFQSHADTCKSCDQKYYAKGLCLKHYLKNYKKRWNERNPDYQKNYAKSYFQKMKKNPKFREKRNAYMKTYMKQKLAKLTITISSQPNTSIFD